MKKNSFILIILAGIFFASCASDNMKQDVYSSFYEEDPVSVLIMPVINDSLEVDMKNALYTTLAKPLCEAGYYVFPPHLAMEILQRESAGDAELFIDKDVSLFWDYFGADMVLFTRINQCAKVALLGKIIVDIDYELRSTKTNAVLYSKNVSIVKDTNIHEDHEGDNDVLFSVISNLIATSINTAITSYEDMVIENSNLGLKYLPAGKYSYKYGLDLEEEAGPHEIKKVE